METKIIGKDRPARSISNELPDKLNGPLVSESGIQGSLVLLRIFQDHRHHTPATGQEIWILDGEMYQPQEVGDLLDGGVSNVPDVAPARVQAVTHHSPIALLCKQCNLLLSTLCHMSVKTTGL